MGYRLCAALCAAVLVGNIGLSFCWAQDAESSSPSNHPAASTPESSADLAAIREGSRAFVDAFNQGDAKAIAALWTENADYTDESGTTFSGR